MGRGPGGSRRRRARRAWPYLAGASVLAVASVAFATLAHAQSAGPPPGTAHLRPIRSFATPAGAITVSPAPGTRTASPLTQLSFLGEPASKLGRITVSGSKTGPHTGRLEAYSTGNGASFLPDRPFAAGETVTVHTSLPIYGSDHGTYHFEVADVVPLRAKPHPPAMRVDVPGVQHFASAPNLVPPAITVDTPDPGIGGGDFFLAPKGPTGQAGPMIVRPDGQLVWFKPLANRQEAFDLNVKRLHGHRVLTWFQGVVVAGHGQGEAVIANRHYQTIAVVKGGNGVKIDLHDLQLTNRGTVFVTAYRTMRWDTASDGGTKLGTVFDGVIQEIDVKTGLVEEEWNSLDHVPVSASDFKAPKSPHAPFDYFHINGVQPMPNGNLLISSRNTSAAFLVDPAAQGNLIWQLGGKHSSFVMKHGTRFWFEHDVRLHAGNQVSIFDDGASPKREPASRALVLHLDLADRTASVVHAFTSPQHLLAAALGNVEERANGDMVVGWGTAPNYSVLGPTGSTIYDAKLPQGDDTYRTYQYPWSGAPTTRPSLAVATSGGTTTVSMSWNGATGVARWVVRSGPSATSLRTVATLPDDAFQTTAPVSGLGKVVQAVAVGATGKVLGRSPVEAS